MSETKRFYIVVSVLGMYGLSELLRSGHFIFPLPLFEILFLIVGIGFFIEKLRSNKFIGTLILLTSVFLFFARSYNYSFFLPDSRIEELSQTLLFDLFYIAYLLSLFLMLLFTYRKNEVFTYAWLVCLLLLGFSTGTNAPLLSILALFIVAFSYWKAKNLFENAHSFWLYLLLFESSRYLQIEIL